MAACTSCMRHPCHVCAKVLFRIQCRLLRAVLPSRCFEAQGIYFCPDQFAILLNPLAIVADDWFCRGRSGGCLR